MGQMARLERERAGLEKAREFASAREPAHRSVVHAHTTAAPTKKNGASDAPFFFLSLVTIPEVLYLLLSHTLSLTLSLPSPPPLSRHIASFS